MAIETRSTQRGPAGATHARKHGCCGRVAEPGTPTEAATHAGHDCCEHKELSPAAHSSCGCDTATAGRPPDAKDDTSTK